MKIEFAVAPLPGTTLEERGQRYEVVAVGPHVRRDGQPTSLLTWRSNCPDCGAMFETVSGLKAKALTRRCPGHRAPRRAVQTDAGEGMVLPPATQPVKDRDGRPAGTSVRINAPGWKRHDTVGVLEFATDDLRCGGDVLFADGGRGSFGRGELIDELEPAREQRRGALDEPERIA